MIPFLIILLVAAAVIFGINRYFAVRRKHTADNEDFFRENEKKPR